MPPTPAARREPHSEGDERAAVQKVVLVMQWSPRQVPSSRWIWARRARICCSTSRTPRLRRPPWPRRRACRRHAPRPRSCRTRAAAARGELRSRALVDGLRLALISGSAAESRLASCTRAAPPGSRRRIQVDAGALAAVEASVCSSYLFIRLASARRAFLRPRRARDRGCVQPVAAKRWRAAGPSRPWRSSRQIPARARCDARSWPARPRCGRAARGKRGSASERNCAAT